MNHSQFRWHTSTLGSKTAEAQQQHMLAQNWEGMLLVTQQRV
jgi:hypothetical protein